ncbi:MAG: B12-binding domain-containing radical SAM protein [Proteobacteria bacterium]|nr:B12-binding domain-containing radical SAM protein [Pseudomonadota bacterium]MBU1717365.1 B12-binding domain-containing radical SAM protein [Pseudomonadota bacterium]
MKKILLISPAYRTKLLENVRVLALPPLNLGLIASHTPAEYEVRILDEAFDDIDYDTEVDLVGITCMTPLAPRAYEISREFRKRGVVVVLGGIHPSMMPEEAGQFADAVVVGEGEELWPQLLQDFTGGRLQKLYRVETRPDITNLPAPRRDLLTNKYFVQTVQTSRGCPHNCKFCSVTRFNGGQYRMRAIDHVIDEINGIPDKRLFIIDDNIIGSGQNSIDRAFRLFARLKETGKEWGGQTCLNIVEHDGLLKAASDGGAKAFLIGFESIEQAVLGGMGKKVNMRPTTRNFKEAIKKIHDHGIAIVGGFIFGTDNDDAETFKRTLDFIMEAEVDAVQLSIQTPLPGTALYQQLAEENRLLLNNYPQDWEAYNIFEPVYQPKTMSPEELYQGLIDAYQTVSSPWPSFKRGVKTFIKTRSLFATGISFFWNYDSYKTISKITKPRIYS